MCIRDSLQADQLAYAFWLYRQTVLGWWKPSAFAVQQGRLWTFFWTYVIQPVMKFFVDRRIRRAGWQGRYQGYLRRLEGMNRFADLDEFRGNAPPPEAAECPGK